MKKPRKIQPHLQNHIDKAIDEILITTPYHEFINDVRGYITDTRRGQAHSKINVFTVPYWAFKPSYPKNLKTNGGYFLYYVAHELAHLITYLKYGGNCNHDYRFYETFMEICPKEHQHFELNYKKTSIKFGITENKS